MDLLSEASNGPRVLTARHVSSDIPPETNNAINTTLLCYTYSLQPDFSTYFAALRSNAWIIWSLGSLVVVTLCILYVFTLRSARQHWKNSATSSAIVLGVYPVVATAALIATIVPRATVLAEAVAQEAVMIALYHFYFMLIEECGGVNQLIRRSERTKLETRVLPCCCWPCCVLPRPAVQKNSLTWLRYLVLQMPIMQAVLYLIILILWAEDMMLYVNNFIYIQPFIAASILTGVWGMMMTVRAVAATGAFPRPRYLALQLVLVIVKLQSGIAKALPGVTSLPCIMALHPSVVVNLIQNMVVLVEMLLLSVWARALYAAPGKSPTAAAVGSVGGMGGAGLDDSYSSNDKIKMDTSLTKHDNNSDLHL